MSYLIEPHSFSQKINYRPPINMKPEWEHLFRPDDKYLSVKLGVRQLSNAFVNHYGLVIKNGLLVSGCAPNIGFSNYDEGFYFEHWQKAMEQMLVSRFGKSIPSIRLDDNRKYLIIHSPWFSNYFWITECIPRLLAVKDLLPELVLIYPENWKNVTYVNDTLSLFPELEKVVIPQDHQMFVKNLIMPEVKPWTPMFIPELVRETRSFLLMGSRKVSAKADKTQTESVYISRRHAARRKFLNEEDMEDFFIGLGISPVYMERLSFFEQIQVMNNAKFACGITGAGLANIHFMNEGSGFLDMTNIGYQKSDIYKFHYHKLCNVLDVKYAVQFFNYEEQKDIERFSQQPLIPDFRLLQKNINLLLD